MSDFAKGCLFVGAAVAAGVFAALTVPSLVGGEPDRRGAIASREPVIAGPLMPDLVGERLDVAEQRLDGRGIAHEAAGDGIFGGIVPEIFDVCETDPPSGHEVRGTARLRVGLPGTCS